jgi:hypothetical protein
MKMVIWKSLRPKKAMNAPIAIRTPPQMYQYSSIHSVRPLVEIMGHAFEPVNTTTADVSPDAVVVNVGAEIVGTSKFSSQTKFTWNESEVVDEV